MKINLSRYLFNSLIIYGLIYSTCSRGCGYVERVHVEDLAACHVEQTALQPPHVGVSTGKTILHTQWITCA